MIGENSKAAEELYTKIVPRLDDSGMKKLIAALRCSFNLKAVTILQQTETTSATSIISVA